MMPDTRPRFGPAAPAPALARPTRFRSLTHTPARPAHTVHTAVAGIPGSARPALDEAARPASFAHTVRFLVHLARWVAPPAGGALLISAGVYAGPWSLVPVPVLLALAAVGFALDTTPAGGEW